MNPPRIAVSRCLLGEGVRYDGRSKPVAAVSRYLAERAELIPVCPEVQCGMPIPREPMELFSSSSGVKLLTVNTQRDLTDMLKGWSLGWFTEMKGRFPRGFVLKSGSPSCGMGTAWFHRNGLRSRDGNGLFAGLLLNLYPHVPAVSETDLKTEDDMERFLSMVKEYHAQG